MRPYFLYTEPIETAKALTKTDLAHQITAYKKLMSNADNEQLKEWLDRCILCFAHYIRDNESMAQWWSNHANLTRPDFLTEEYCEMQRKLLRGSAPKKYAGLV